MKYIAVNPLTEKSIPYKAGDEIELTEERAKQLGNLVKPLDEGTKQIESQELENKMISSTDLMNKKVKSTKKKKS